MGPPSVGSVDVRVLGPLEVVLGGRPLDVPGRRERAVLALLAIEVGRPVEATRLTELLWDADPPRTADKTLQTFVSRLRHVLHDPDLLVRRERSYLLDLPAEATDLGRFRRLIRRAAAASDEGEADTALAALDAAVGLWRGERPADLGSTTTARGLEQLVRNERRAAVEALIAARLAAGQLEPAVATAESELVAHPGHEPLWTLLMQAHVAAGRPTAALEAYERARRWLADELGLDPSPALAALHARILRGDGSHRRAATTSPTPTEAPLRSTGASAATTQAAGRRVRPPPALSPLVGRDEEVRILRHALRGDRLVTLTGTGGVGKTRLALEVVAASNEAVWCDLARLGAGSGIEEAVATAAGIAVPPDASTWVTVTADLTGRAVTLVLDNCEHVLDAARLAAVELLRSCPDLTVLATSRQPLSIAGERVLPLAPLATEAGGPAAALLTAAITRAGADPPTVDDGELLERVCERLDGLPLALELAAPAVRTLGLRGVLEGLSRRFQLLDVAWDATGRERDLRGTVAWSETLLPAPSRQLLRATSVFAGAFTAAMAAEVCAAQVADIDAALASLVDRSLVEPAGGAPHRYRLLENVRAYGREALGGSALDELRDHHAGWIAARCDRVYDRFWEGDEVVLTRSLTEVMDEVRAAIDWVLSSGDADAGLRIAAGLHGPTFLGVRTEGAAWMKRLVERFGDTSHPRAAAAWGGLAHWLLVCEGDADGAADAATMAAAVADGPPPAVLWQYRVEVALRAYDVETAQRLLDEARRAGLPAGWDHIIEAGIVPTEDALGRRDRAVERVRRLAPVAQRSPCLVLRQMSRMGTALIEHEDDPYHVLEVMRDVLATVLAADNRYMGQLVTMVTATYAGRSGDLALAVTTFEDVLGRWAAVGAWRYEWNTIREVTTLLASARAHEDVVVLDTAARGSATAPGLVGEQLEVLDAAVTAAREGLPEEVFAAASRRGAALTDRDALTFARVALARLRP